MMCIGDLPLWAVTVFYYDGSNNTMMIFLGCLVVKVINDAQLLSGHFVDFLSHLVLLFNIQIICAFFVSSQQ